MANGRDTEHLVVLRFDPQRDDGAGAWHIYSFANGKRMFRLDFKREKPAVWMAAKLVDELQRNGWRVRWRVQDENGLTMGTNLVVAARKMKVRGGR